MNVTWCKIWRDLGHRANRGHTLLAVVSIAVGVFALGVIFGAHEIIGDRIARDYQAWIPVHITLWGWAFDEAVEEAALREHGVAGVERLADTSFRWRLEGERAWRDGVLIAREDYEAQHIGLVELREGHWPTNRTLAVERMSSRYFDVPLGTAIVAQFGNRERRLSVEGVVRDAGNSNPPQFGGDATFFATPETVAWLVDRDLNRLDVRLESPDTKEVQELADQVRERLDHIGAPASGIWIREPGEHWFQDSLDTAFVIMVVLGALSLGLSVFLIINTLNAIIVQQVWQIGVMKVVGATFGRVVGVYLMMALAYGGLSLLLAVPLGAIGAHWLARWILDIINVDMVSFQIVPAAVGVQAAVGLVVPVLAALVPVIGGARITAHQAISAYGLGGRFGRGWLDRLLGRIGSGRSPTAPQLSRPAVLSLRNTFRRKARVALTLMTLALGGAMFMMVMSVNGSFRHTIEMLISDFGDDVNVGFARPYRVDRLVEVAESVPGVVSAEIWGGYYGTRLKLASGEERYIGIWGLPPGSEVFNPRIVGGRMLLSDDDHAILLNHTIAVEEGIQVGDQVRFDLYGQETAWTVVGLVLFVYPTQSFVPFDALAQETGSVGRGTRVIVVSEEHDTAYQKRLVQDLRDAYAANGIKATWSWSSGEMRESQWEQFEIILYLLLSMAILAAAVGGIGLMSTASINVVERRREIGVMRATGATSSAIAGIFVGEGVLLGVLSWLFAVPLSYPGARLFSDVVGGQLLNLPLDFVYSVGGMLLWLGIVIGLSALASLWPALQATEVSVREALAYE